MTVLHLLSGPNGSGKSTFAERVLIPATGLPFVNADDIAKEIWPGAEERNSYEAAKLAAKQRKEFLQTQKSFVTETVFSHKSKNELITHAMAAGFLVHLHVTVVPLSLSIARVSERVSKGGHSVPEEKIIGRYERIWPLIAHASSQVDEATFYLNTSGNSPFRVIARYELGEPIFLDWPSWIHHSLRS